MGTKRKGGAPTKYTPDTVERIATAIKLGMPYELAAQYGGITYTTFREWILDPSKSEFSNTIKAAEADGLARILAQINTAASEGNWQAGAWIAERRYPQHFGKRVLEVQVDANVTLKWEEEET